MRAIATFLLVLLAACGSSGTGGAADTTGPADTSPDVRAAGTSITPGVGVTVDGAAFALGTTLPELTARFGAPADRRDLGPLGVRFGYPALGLAGLLASSADDAPVTTVYVEPGFAGAMDAGVGLGSDEAAVRAQLGDPVVDPFAGVWWYRDAGVALQWESGAVVRVLLFRPAP